MDRTRLCDAIERALAERGMLDEDLAEELGIPPKTFQHWVGQNRFPRAHADWIAERLDLVLHTESLEEQYAFEVARRNSRTPAPAAPPPARYERIEQLAPNDASARIASIYGALGPGDACAVWSADRLPMEFEPARFPDVAQAQRQATELGARFAYLHPEERAAAELASRGLNAVLQPAACRRLFRELLSDTRAARSEPDPEPRSQLIACETLPLLAPGTLYLLVHQRAASRGYKLEATDGGDCCHALTVSHGAQLQSAVLAALRGSRAAGLFSCDSRPPHPGPSPEAGTPGLH